MQVATKTIAKNKLKLTITADIPELDAKKKHILEDHFQKDMKLAGFRQGKVPIELVEKNADPNQVQGQFLDEIINDLYTQAIYQEKLKVVDQPKVEISKFVPYSQLEFTAEVPVLENIKLPDYKNIKLAKPKIKPVTKDEIDEVIERIRTQMATKNDVDRACKDGDQVWIDFDGVDDKGKPVEGAKGSDYPLTLGSNTFIPGFETNLIGLKPNDKKTFTLKFPKDYHIKALSGRDVTFSVDIIKVQELVKPPIDDELAIKSGPFANLAELKEDIKKQLDKEKQNEADRAYEGKLLKTITAKTSFDIPDTLVDNDIESKLKELKQNLTYRGQTFEEYLKQEKLTEEELRNKQLKPEAIDRLRNSIVLSEIAEVEGVKISNSEVDARIEQIKQQYNDPSSQEEINKPEFRQQTGSRMVAEKTIELLVKYSTSK
jgi:trigger factor